MPPLCKVKKNINRRHLGFAVGFVISLFLIMGLSLPAAVTFHAPGALNVGHEKLECRECHIEVDATLRQQLQAQAQYLLGNRKTPVDIGHKPVTNDDCIACHARDNDIHPVFRFFEPKYTKARKELAPQFCVSCHREHSGVRVTADALFCDTCHEKLTLKEDPVDTSHQQLIKEKKWESCLGCHDYHGNHKRDPQKKLAEAIVPSEINNYFEKGDSPYGENRRYKAKESRYHESE